MKVGDLVLYWPQWGPMKPQSESEPAGIATLLKYDSEEWKLAERKPPNPKWQILFNGQLLWASTWQVHEVQYETR